MLYVNGKPYSGVLLMFSDEGVNQGRANEITFVGDGVTVSVSGDKATVTITGGTPGAHATRHQDGGVDEISIAGLAGIPAELTTHAGAADPHTVYALVAGDTYTGAHDFGGATSVEVPNGAGGTTVDAVGEACVDSTSRTLNFHDGTAEVVLNPVFCKAITIESPTAAEDLGMFFVEKAVTITKIVAVLVGSATPSVTWTIRHGTDRSAAGAEVVTGGTVTTSTTGGSVVTSFNDATVVADSFIWVETTAQSGTVGSLQIIVFGRYDP